MSNEEARAGDHVIAIALGARILAGRDGHRVGIELAEGVALWLRPDEARMLALGINRAADACRDIEKTAIVASTTAEAMEGAMGSYADKVMEAHRAERAVVSRVVAFAGTECACESCQAVRQFQARTDAGLDGEVSLMCPGCEAAGCNETISHCVHPSKVKH